MKNKLEMLLELDRQVEATWKTSRIKDDDRKLAADKVISAWEAKMRSYKSVRLDGKLGVGLNVNQVGNAFRRANTKEKKSEGPEAVIFVKQSGKQSGNITSTVQAFMNYFGA